MSLEKASPVLEPRRLRNTTTISSSCVSLDRPPGLREEPIVWSARRLWVCDVLHDQLRGKMVASRSDVVNPGSQLPASVASPQGLRILVQFPGLDVLGGVHRLPVTIPLQPARKRVHPLDLWCQRFHLPPSSYPALSNQMAQSFGHSLAQRLPTAARYPDAGIRRSASHVRFSSGSHPRNCCRKTPFEGTGDGGETWHRPKQRTFAPAFEGPSSLSTAWSRS